MKEKGPKKSFWKNCWLDVIVITVLTVILSANINMSKFSPSILYQSNTSGDQFTTDLFFRISNSAKLAHVEPDITLIDIDSIKGRIELANLLSQVLEMKPKAIGFDVLFEDSKDSSEDSTLVGIIGTLREKGHCVYATAYKDSPSSCYPDISHSFFMSEADSLVEGFVNFIYDEKYMNVRQFRVEKLTNEGIQQSLTYRMVTSQNEGKEMQDSVAHYIDYRLSSFNELSANKLDSSLINNRWVLIGSLSRNHDNYNTPIGMMPGLIIHAYTLKTLLSKQRIQQASKVWDWIVLFIVSLLSSIGLVYADFLVFNTKNKIFGLIIQEGFFTVMIVFLQVTLLLLLAYLLFDYCNVFFSMQSSLNGALFVAALVKVLFAICMAYLSKKNMLKQLSGVFMYYSINQ